MAKIDLVYPKIPGSRNAPSGRCIAFEKLDGTNLHWAWDAEYGWTTFGTRRDSFYLDRAGIPEFHAAHPGLEEAPALFLNSLPDAMVKGAKKAVLFTEFLGPNSFAGRHKKDDPKSLVLFDAQIDGAMLGPDAFVERFGSLTIPRIVNRGKLTGKFADDVRNGAYGVAEGVVCKGDGWMVKIKTHAYMERLKKAFADDWESYWE